MHNSIAAVNVITISNLLELQVQKFKVKPFCRVIWGEIRTHFFLSLHFVGTLHGHFRKESTAHVISLHRMMRFFLPSICTYFMNKSIFLPIFYSLYLLSIYLPIHSHPFLSIHKNLDCWETCKTKSMKTVENRWNPRCKN